MNWEAWVTLAVVVVTLYALARSVGGPDMVLFSAAAVLVTGRAFSDRFPSPADLASGFGNEGVLTIAVLFVVVAGLTETGTMSHLGDRLLGRPRTVGAAQSRLMLMVAGLSSFMNNTPLVAMFTPVVGDWARRTGFTPSKLLIPLSYAAVLGGLCTLIGTSTNLVVQGLMIQAQKTDPSMPTMGMFTIGAVGVPVAIAGVAFVVLTSRWLLVDRRPARAELGDPRQYTVEMLVLKDSAIEGRTIEQAGLRHLPGTYLAAIERDREMLVPVAPEQSLRGGDRLIFVGIVESVVDLQKVRGLVPATDQVFKVNGPRHDRCLVEAVISPACPLVGMSIREGRFRSRYDAAVIAVHRNGERIARKIGDIVLSPGDTLLLETHPQFLKYYRNLRDFLLLSALNGSNPRRHDRSARALVIFGAMVVAGAISDYSGFSLLNAALLAAALMIVAGCCSVEQARQSIDWPVLVAIGAALTVGRAIQTSGLASLAATHLIAATPASSPWLVLAQVYLLTLVFTELVTNNAAAVLAFPIAHAAASALHVNVMPFVLAVAVASSSGFATPLGYQTHLMVYGAGNYRFGDFVRIGAPLDLLVAGIAIGLLPLAFPF